MREHKDVAHQIQGCSNELLCDYVQDYLQERDRARVVVGSMPMSSIVVFTIYLFDCQHEYSCQVLIVFVYNVPTMPIKQNHVHMSREGIST